jgi:peptidoglycan/xylan/chitin deacetylase (PgdA/CDA1 family)
VKLYKSNILFKTIYPKLIWDIPVSKPTIFLTFDDGPVPEATEFVLNQLEINNAKATFFCIGDNINKNPALFNKIVSNGHSVGNHTMTHLNGWSVDNEQYIKNFTDCQSLIPDTTLFRPPYGKIKKSQEKIILKTHEIVMWDVISYDFSIDLKPEAILEKCIKFTRSGTIIVFHDSLKAFKNMSYVLPKYLAYFKERGFSFESINLK